MRRLALVTTVVACAVAAPAQAGSGLLIGAAEDSVKQADVGSAAVQVDLARLAGLDALRITALWAPGERRVEGGELVALRNAALAAELGGVRLFVSVYPDAARNVPLTATARDDFASYAASIVTEVPYVRDVIVGNEPNLNYFWQPQFTRTGGDAAAPAYMSLLATTYDALKRVDPDVRVIGGALSPRGSDRSGTRPTHSPTTFIRDLGVAYRASGRERPLMDVFALHPYLESSSLPPTFRHPRSTSISINDYDKLVALLGEAFDDTAQPGRSLPVLYGEFGIQSAIAPAKSTQYTNHGATSAGDAVSEARQAAYYRKALELAYCQPTVVGLFFFHVLDESDLRAWQSGLFYADRTPKTSLEPVRQAADAARAGTLVTCRRERIAPLRPPLAFTG